jgi:hypothetical protein
MAIPPDFAHDWIDSWNARSLHRILEHYADDVLYRSPLIPELAGKPDGTLRGKGEVKLYFAKALAAYPDLHFELLGSYVGLESTVIHYRSVKDLVAAETFRFNADGKVCEVLAHYSPAS